MWNMFKKQLKYIALWLFLLGIVFIVFLQVLSGQNINRLIESNQSVLNELSIQNDLRRLEVDVLTVESDIRGGVITQNHEYFNNIDAKIKNIHSELASLEQLLSSKNAKQDISQLHFLVREKIKFSYEIINTFNTKGQNAAQTEIISNRGKGIRDSLVQIISRLDSSRQTKLHQIIGSIENSGSRARTWGFVLSVIACLVVILAFWQIVNQGRQQQRMIIALNESEKKIKEAANVKEQFVANMSHEIRTPMNAILGFTNLLQKTKMDEQQLNYVNFIQSSGENLLTLINDILDFSKIEAGMMHMEEAPFSLHGLLNSIETMFREKAVQKNLQLSIIVEPDIHDTLKGDAVRLTQIIINLLSNAIKFTNEGSVTITVKCLTQTPAEVMLQFNVKDTGIGIALDKQKQIFERFRQAEADTTRRYGGSGLGLSIVKQLVELQQGTIEICSQENKGTEFIVVLPFKKAAEASMAALEKTGPVNALVKDVNVLVAEDNQMNQQLIQHLMKHWQIGFRLVQTGREAIEALRQHPYSLVLMDIQMPEMDGYTATEHIRNELKLQVPIIAMTAHAMVGEREKCLSYGMNDYISKPLNESELYSLIQKHTAQQPAMKQETEPIIDLNYLKDLSKGDTEFENAIIRQFILQLPEELDLLQEAIEKENMAKIKSLAHGMKSSVGYLGLTNRLQQSLQRMETEAVNNAAPHHFQEDFDHVKQVCEQAITEAKKLLGQVFTS